MGWLRQLLGRKGEPAAPAPSPTLHATTSPEPAFGQRRPLVGKSGQVIGFELRLPRALERRVQALNGAGAAPAQVANFVALLAAAREA